MTGDQQLAELAKSLAHAAHLRIARLLLPTPGCIGGDVVEAVGHVKSTALEHQRIHKSAGVILGEYNGQRVCYSLNQQGVAQLANLIGSPTAPSSAACCAPQTKATAPLAPSLLSISQVT